MTTKREAILVALHAYLVAALPDLTVLRNPALADIVDGKAIGLRDGEIDLVEEYFNGPIYEWTMTPSITVIFEKGGVDLDAKVDAVIDALDLALLAAGDLGGLVQRVETQPAQLGVQEIWGSPDIKGAELPIEIDYWSDRPVG